MAFQLGEDILRGVFAVPLPILGQQHMERVLEQAVAGLVVFLAYNENAGKVGINRDIIHFQELLSRIYSPISAAAFSRNSEPSRM